MYFSSLSRSSSLNTFSVFRATLRCRSRASSCFLSRCRLAPAAVACAACSDASFPLEGPLRAMSYTHTNTTQIKTCKRQLETRQDMTSHNGPTHLDVAAADACVPPPRVLADVARLATHTGPEELGRGLVPVGLRLLGPLPQGLQLLVMLPRHTGGVLPHPY